MRIRLYPRQHLRVDGKPALQPTTIHPRRGTYPPQFAIASNATARLGSTVHQETKTIPSAMPVLVFANRRLYSSAPLPKSIISRPRDRAARASSMTSRSPGEYAAKLRA